MLDLAILIITIGGNLALAFLILIKNSKPKENKVFIFFILSVVSWVMANYFADHSISNAQALYWSQISWITAACLLAFGSIFVLYFPYKDARGLKTGFIAITSITILFILFCLSDLFNEFIFKEALLGANGIADYVYGDYFIYGSLFFVLLTAFILIKFFIKYRKVKGFKKLQSKYFLIGWLLFLLLGIIFSLVLPFVTKNAIWSKFAPLFTISVVALTTYAIIKHRLMDIRVLIQRTILYTATFGIFLVLYLSLIFVLNKFFTAMALVPSISSVISGGLVIVFYPRFKLYLQKKTNRIFYRYPYDANRVLKEIHEKCSRQIDFDIFFDSFVATIESNLKINKILLIVLQKNERPLLVKNYNFTRKLADFFKATAYPPKIFEYFNRHKSAALINEKHPELENLVADAELSRQPDFLKKCGVEFILPVYQKNLLSAFFFFGPKLSQENYYPQDLQLFETLMDTLGMAFENIFLYNNLKRALKGLEEKVDLRTEELKELTANQSRFMADISHELQTPLAILKGNLSLLNQQKMDPAEARKHYSQMERSIDRLFHLLKDLIFLSKADAGKVNIKKEDFNLSDLVQRSFDDSLILSEDKGIKLDSEIEKNIWIFGDQNLMQSLLFNFISNALKYTEPNKTVNIKLIRKNNLADLAIEDQGVGIAPENLTHIFSRFYRIEQPNKIKGTGLGLAICKWIVEAHDGKISIKSQLGQGTIISVDLPCKIEPREDTPRY